MPDKQGWTEFQKESWDAQYGNTIAQGWRFVRDTGDAGNYNTMDTDNEDTLISSGDFSKVVRRLVAYTKKTKLPTFMLFGGAWYYITREPNGTFNIQHNIHDSAADYDVDSLGISKPLAEWNLEERKRYLEIRDRRDAAAKAKLHQVAALIRATGTEVKIEELPSINNPEYWWHQ